MPNLLDQDLRVELIACGLKFPTTMASVGKDDILVRKKMAPYKRVVNVIY